MIDRDDFAMRAPCRFCGHDRGSIRDVNGQDVVRCRSCGRANYNAPRIETGRTQRSVTTIHAAVRPKQRARILARASARCELCGARSTPAAPARLHVGHIVSVDAGLRFGLTDIEINDDENLLCLCEECNLGFGKEPMPLRIAVTVLRARIAWRDHAEPASALPAATARAPMPALTPDEDDT